MSKQSDKANHTKGNQSKVPREVTGMRCSNSEIQAPAREDIEDVQHFFRLLEKLSSLFYSLGYETEGLSLTKVRKELRHRVPAAYKLKLETSKIIH